MKNDKRITFEEVDIETIPVKIARRHSPVVQIIIDTDYTKAIKISYPSADDLRKGRAVLYQTFNFAPHKYDFKIATSAHGLIMYVSKLALDGDK